jgi:Fe-S cluster assembly iron-binding protein IscA
MLYLSERAGAELRKRIEASSSPDPRLRIFIDRRCNCGRPRFGLCLDERAAESDSRFEVDGVPFIADQETVPELSAAEIDYFDDWMQRGVAARNIYQCGSC